MCIDCCLTWVWMGWLFPNTATSPWDAHLWDRYIFVFLFLRFPLERSQIFFHLRFTDDIKGGESSAKYLSSFFSKPQDLDILIGVCVHIFYIQCMLSVCFCPFDLFMFACLIIWQKPICTLIRLSRLISGNKWGALQKIFAESFGIGVRLF